MVTEMADDEIVVEIDKEVPVETPEQKAKSEKAEKAEKNDPVADLKAQYEELQAKEERERKGREESDRRADSERQARTAAEAESQTLRGEVADTRLATVEEGIKNAQTQAESAQAEYVAAQEAGDWKKAGEAQRKISRAEATLVRLDEAKSDLEARKTEAPQRQQQPSGDPVENFLSQRTPQTRQWLRDHPDDARALALGTDTRRAAKINAAHAVAVDEGNKIDSPEYFARIEDYLGMTQKPEPKAAAQTNGKEPAKRKANAPVAPVNASSGGTSGGGTEVRLSASEAKAAVDGTLVWNWNDPGGKFKKGDPIGVSEFARRKNEMTKEGRYDPMNFIQQ